MYHEDPFIHVFCHFSAWLFILTFPSESCHTLQPSSRQEASALVTQKEEQAQEMSHYGDESGCLLFSSFLCDFFVTEDPNMEAALTHIFNALFTCQECEAQTWLGSGNMVMWDQQTRFQDLQLWL